MKKLILLTLAIGASTLLPAQTDSTALRIKQLQAEAERKAQAAAAAAEAANRAAKEAADAAAKLAAEAKTQSEAATQNAKKATANAAKQTVRTEPKAEVQPSSSNKANTAKVEEWKAPEATESPKKAESWDDSYDFDKNSPVYLSADAVPLVDGKVEWVCNLPNTGKSDAQLKKGVDAFFRQLKAQKAVSTAALIPSDNGSTAYAVIEKLTFTANFISLDQTQFSYVLEAKVQNGNASLTMSNLRYNYNQDKKVERYNAEDWITDKQAVNKKHTRLLPITGKFRRKTIDRKNELFQQFKDIVL